MTEMTYMEITHMETTDGGQRAVTKMIASGVFDRHPSLKVIVLEGGATWGFDDVDASVRGT